MRQVDSVDRLWARAQAQFAARDLDAARTSLESLLATEPGHVMAWLRLSTLATGQGRYRDSLDCLLRVAALRPSEPQLLLLVAGMLHRLGESRVAIEMLAHPALPAWGDRAGLQQAAQLASQLEQTVLARALLDQAERLGGADANSLYTRATLSLFDGDLDASERELRACLARSPGHAQAWWSLSRLRRQQAGSDHVKQLRQLQARGPDPTSAAFLGFALFKELDDLGRHDEAWDALMQGCNAKRQQLNYQAADEEAAFHALGCLLANPTDVPVPQDSELSRPIFIVGLPRTGTTLLERILGRHQQVCNAGELDDFPLQLRWCADRFSKSFFDASIISSAARTDPGLLGRRYLQHAAWRSGGRPVFTDKLPMNFLYIGWIARALPQARILHMTRNPMDSCFSNLKELFTDAYPYSYDLHDLAGHYGRYRRLMAHWHEQFPGRVMDVAYEDLVENPEATSRAVLAHCGLDWSAQLLRIEQGSGTVTTASAVQVREPIHRRSVQAWRAYEAQLQPLQSALRKDGWVS